MKLVKLNSKIYPVEVILNACHAFIDRAYIFLDISKQHKDVVNISFKPKKKISYKQVQSLRGEFFNELLHSALRYQVSKNNKKIREYIIGRALYSAIPAFDLMQNSEKLDFQEDPLGITIPWEEKYGKSKSNKVKIKQKNI